MSNFVESLRSQTQQAIAECEARKQLEKELRELAEEERDALRMSVVAQFVTEQLPIEIKTLDEAAEKAAKESKFSVIWSRTVTTHTTEPIVQVPHRVITGEVEEDLLKTETGKTLTLREALQSHYDSQGFKTTTTQKADGFREEVSDYGPVFHQTAIIYGLEISWLPQEESAPSAIVE